MTCGDATSIFETGSNEYACTSRLQCETASLSDQVWHVVVKWDSFARECLGQSLVQSLDTCALAILRYANASHQLLERATLVEASLSLSEARYLLWRARERFLMTEQCCDSLLVKMDDLNAELQQLRADLCHRISI